MDKYEYWPLDIIKILHFGSDNIPHVIHDVVYSDF